MPAGSQPLRERGARLIYARDAPRSSASLSEVRA
jgi:hypothetical protein